MYRTSRCGAIDLMIEPSGAIEVKTFLGVGPVGKAGSELTADGRR